MARKKVTEDGEIVDVPELAAPAKIQLADEMLGSEYQPFFKTPWNHDTLLDAKNGATIHEGDTLTQQHQAADTNINVIMEKFGVTAVRAALINIPRTFADMPEHMDPAEVVEVIRQGEEAFMQLPATVRETFANDPVAFLAYVQQRQEAGDKASLEKLGLVDPTPPKPPEEPAAEKK